MERLSVEEMSAAFAHRFSRRQLRALALYLLYIKNRSRRRHACWVRPIFQQRQRLGQFHTLVNEMLHSDHSSYFKFFCMMPTMFNELAQLVHDRIYRQTTSFRESISVEERLAITLRYLVSGDLQRNLSYSFRVGRQTVSAIIIETCNALWDTLLPIVMSSPTQEQFVDVAQRFWDLWQFPHCCGAIDGKYVHIQAPGNSRSECYNQNGSFSYVLIAVCDADHRFLVVNIDDNGCKSDGDVFGLSQLGRSLHSGGLKLPDPQPLAHHYPYPAPYSLVGDAAFPFHTYLMRPYSGRDLPLRKAVFNYRLLRARRSIENTFGILTARFRILRRPINTKLKTAIAIGKACVCLHNFIMARENNEGADGCRYCPPGFIDSEEADGNVHPGEWRTVVVEDNGMTPLRNTELHSCASAATAARNNLTEFFMCEEGSLSWQEAIVHH